jgi:hypothetical protein
MESLQGTEDNPTTSQHLQALQMQAAAASHTFDLQGYQLNPVALSQDQLGQDVAILLASLVIIYSSNTDIM